MQDRWSATERIFHAALARPAESRAAFVATACGDDDELRRDVQSLLDQTSSTDFLEQPALHVAAGLVAPESIAPLTGQKIGVYSIKALLGRGGMGEVYQARDTRLGREVAIKVLPRAFTVNADRLARFEREARVLASLNHPHIGMLYGVEESGGHLALILELIEGATLAERLVHGPVPVKEALTWGRQIADALDAAHEKGIVHRDLKPANVKITPQHVVKVLDFGLARTYGAEADSASRSPTITLEKGVIVGTAAYMSPEQARGEGVDKRADIWAFGCVLYEMLCGRIAFAAPTVADTLAAVLHREPDWTALPAGLPPTVMTLLRRCLEKDVRQRRRDIGDVRAELDDAITQPAATTADPAAGVPASRRLTVRTTLAVAGVIAAVALGVVAGRWIFAETSGLPAEARFKRITELVGVEEMPAVSPDGKDVAFVARAEGRRQIWVRRLTGGHALRITLDDIDHDHPRWSPDSSSIVYFTPPVKEGEAGMLWEIPSLGGPPRRLASSWTGADVSHKGDRLATLRRTTDGIALAILGRDGATLSETISTKRDSVDFHPPRWSPDDSSIAALHGTNGFRHDLVVVDLATRATRVLTHATHIKGIAWLPDGGGLVFASSTGSTMGYPPVFNLRWVSRDGSRELPLTVGDVSYEQPDIVRTGQLFAARVFMRSDVWRFPVSGSPADNVRNGTQITRQTGYVQTPSVSPDGTEIAYLSDSGGHSNVWVAKVDGSENPRPLTSEDDVRVVIGIPIWSPIDNRIVFIRSAFEESSEGVNQTEWIINSDGSDRRLLAKDASSAAWSADGQWVYYQSPAPACIYKVRTNGSASPVLVRCNAAVPALASDGTLYFAPRAFQNANEIHKAKPEGDEKAVLVTRYPTSRVPLWPTGFALSPDGRLIAVPLRDSGTTNLWAIPTDGGPYRQLTDFGQRPILIARQVSWSRDGKLIYAALSESDADIVLLEGMGLTPQ